MTDLFEAMIAMQREQLKVAERFMAAGRDAVAAQAKTADAMKVGSAAMKSWMAIWGVKP